LKIISERTGWCSTVIFRKAKLREALFLGVIFSETFFPSLKSLLIKIFGSIFFSPQKNQKFFSSLQKVSLKGSLLSKEILNVFSSDSKF